MAKMEPLKTGLAGATKKSEVIQFLWHLKKQGLKENTIKCYDAYLKTLVNSGANLLDSESVKETIANKKWSRNTKALAIASYSRFLEFKGVSWKPPRNKRVRKLPFIPLEKEIDALISGSRKKLATFLQLLKETGLRSGEAWCLKWKDIDFQNRTITINEPEKHGKPRMLKISPTMVAMLKAMQTENERVFIGKLPFFRESFRYFRQRLSVKLKNPRLLRITFHTFRHWKATMEYHKTKDILYVKQLLGHRDINTTLLYTQLVNFESDEYHTATAKTVEEATKLAEAGFEYFDALENVHIYRKRK
ncbi:site-specific integrase [Candidatus Bathyarchaeota archaeon]|nr:site-specific integrase [Candidatus Bathyarchaeota archaeon]